VDRPWDKTEERTPPPGYVQHFEDSRMADEAIQQGHQLVAEEKFDRARREYRTALALKPYSAAAHMGLAYLCYIESTWEQALEHYIRAAEFDPRSAGAHYGIGRVLLEMDRENDAVMEFERALALDPALDAARDALTALGKAA
jgi:tetratricopeptide (TPR) repeat protein